MVANIAVLFSQLTLAVLALHHRLDQNLESEGLEECWDRHGSSPSWQAVCQLLWWKQSKSFDLPTNHPVRPCLLRFLLPKGP